MSTMILPEPTTRNELFNRAIIGNVNNIHPYNEPLFAQHTEQVAKTLQKINQLHIDFKLVTKPSTSPIDLKTIVAISDLLDYIGIWKTTEGTVDYGGKLTSWGNANRTPLMTKSNMLPTSRPNETWIKWDEAVLGEFKPPCSHSLYTIMPSTPFYLVMPSIEAIQWLNKLNSYVTALQRQTKKEHYGT